MHGAGRRPRREQVMDFDLAFLLVVFVLVVSFGLMLIMRPL
jgi:hypothetical protein